MNIRIRHLTRYIYPESVQFNPHRVLLRPREHPQLQVAEFALSVSPEARIRWMTDPLENHIAVVFFNAPSNEIRIEANILAVLHTENPFDFILEPYAENYPFAYNPHEGKALRPYLEVGSPADCARVLPWIHTEFPRLPDKSLEVLTELNRRIHQRFRYQRRDEEGVQSPDQTIDKGSGSCRDFARLFIEMCRQLGFAARFVSGYLYDPPSGSSHFENVAEGAMHAWVEVHLPGAGWKGFDPTNGMLATNYFIPCAVGIEPKLTSPVQGTYYHTQLRIPSTLEVTLSLEQEADH